MLPFAWIRITVCLLVMLPAGTNAVWGQELKSIHFEGLRKSRPQVLRQLLRTRVGSPVDLATIESDAQQLRNHNGIQSVEYRLDTLEQGLALTFVMQEKLTLLPILGFGGVTGNLFFQLGFTDINWLGLGHQLAAFYQLNDFRSNYSFYYRAPRLGGSQWGASVGFNRRATVEPLYFSQDTVFYDYDFLSFGGTAIYNLDRKHFLEVGGNYFIENYLKNARHENELTPGPEGLRAPKVLGKLIHVLDRRNYDYFYLDGFDNRLSYQFVYDSNAENWFHMVLNDTRFFRKVGGGGNLALRTRLGIATNRMSPFAPFVLDSYVNIRGVGNRVDRGTGTLVLNLEYRQTLLDRPAFAIQGVVFSDLGSWRKPGGELSDFVNRNHFRHFAGGGLRGIYKKVFNATLRIDYGVDIYTPTERGFVVGIGQYF